MQKVNMSSTKISKHGVQEDFVPEGRWYFAP